MELPRSAPIRPTLHSKSIRNHSSLRPLSPDANELYFQNMKLSEENENLKKQYEMLRREYDRLIHVIDVRKNVRRGILDRKYVDERQDYVNRMREKYGKDLDMGTYTEQMLVGYDDPAIEYSPRGRNLNGGSSVKKKKKPKKTKKAKRGKTKKRTVPKNKKLQKKACKTECDKTNKILPIMLKKMGLSQKEIDIKLKEHKDNCEGNCLKLINDKSLIEEIMKNK